jgi:hypothetical protein
VAEAAIPVEAWPICSSMGSMVENADWAALDPDFAAGKRAIVAGDWNGAIKTLTSAGLRDDRNADPYATDGSRSCVVSLAAVQRTLARPAMRPSRRPRRGPKPDRGRAIELLADAPDGCSEAIMLAHGFTVDMLIELVSARLATAQTERMVVGGRRVEVIRFRITEAGRQALSQLRWP